MSSRIPKFISKMILKCWRIAISININIYIEIDIYAYKNIIFLFLFLILICRDFLPGINFEGSDLAWKKKKHCTSFGIGVEGVRENIF